MAGRSYRSLTGMICESEGPNLPLPEIGHTPPTSSVIASAAKLARVFPRRKTGLLRCARNDDADGVHAASLLRPRLAQKVHHASRPPFAARLAVLDRRLPRARRRRAA